ncbi:phenylalanine--tRNA ligase subunit beta [Veillonella magna]|uniref:Phenylalanine--tRNA ligase beta subunit n=1 Tax=Veillonella magna TaxID=464322 RepID=A0ABS2GES2_9FIRM|nr:phenylalanine--tRNA ligase subunit beta [Veillonella magna]MBM6824218.1 phenylalanine--tRNA ligase subunit beta [Veillonella magna]MBM6912511.1 phenylalanine--tRNA ligase subunit beta [Veillonella magna]
MKASLTWMNEYVPVDMNRPAQELADELTQAGIPVEEVETVDPGLKKIFTGKITEITKHPDADKLQVCQVACLDTDGTPITKQIITAATNVRVGQIVPVAYHKSRLADGTEIKKGKLRGLPSEGMFCSVAELGISKELVVPEEAEGIYILPADTPIGMDIRDVLMMNDTVYEFELTPNRADCFSMVGLSREFAVLTNQKAVLPEITVDENGEAIDGKVQVTIADGDLCSRFAARLVTGVTVAPSPMWLQNRLRNSGIRPINNVVDVTNYVMLELGQPMHAYDYAHVKGHSLTARRANEGEVLKTLDGTDRELTTDMLVIADEQRAVGVAGVMGGYDSEVTNTTTDVLLEAAVFNGASIRRTARALGMRSEASGRFERGVNPEYSIMAINRAAQLLQQLCPDAKIAKGIVDVYPNPAAPTTVTTTADAINAYLGTDIDEQRMVDILTTLSFDVTCGNGSMVIGVPSWRGDVTVMPDIAEEVARIYGYDNIKVTTPWAALNSGVLSERKQMTKTIAHTLANNGLSEMITFSFMHKDSLAKLMIPEGDARYKAVQILNPISEEYPVMRTTLVPSILDAAVRNRAQKNHDIWAFETAAVYEEAVDKDSLPTERYMAAGFMTGRADEAQWSVAARQTDFYDVKGVVEAVLVALRVENYTLTTTDEPYYHPGVSAAYKVDGVTIATLGELHPQVAKNYDLEGKCYLFEINISALLETVRSQLQYTPISKFPGITRDLAIVAPKSVSAETIQQIIVANGGDKLESAYVFDVYEGEHIAEGFRSLAYTIGFRSTEGTLTDADVDEPIQAIINALAEKDCKLR